MKFFKTSPDKFDYAQERTCRNCSHVFQGKYCNHCGERVRLPEDKAIVRILAHFFQGLTFIEGRFMNTLRAMIRRPGELSNSFIHGATIRFMRPVDIFFVANLVYFLFPASDTFNSGLQTQMHFLPHSEIATGIVQKQIEKEQTTLEDFQLRYEQQSTNMAKIFLIIFVFLVAIALYLINFGNQFYFHDHLMVSLEFNSIFILLNLVIIQWLFVLVQSLIPGELNGLGTGYMDTFYTLISVIFSVLVLFQIEKRVYARSKRAAWGKSAILVLALFISLQVYRGILFFITIWTM